MQKYNVCLLGEHQAQVDLQRELEQLRESNRAIQAEKSALQQQLADFSAAIG